VQPLLTILLFGLAGWTFWPVLFDLAERWRTDPQYSHCAIVPFVSLYVLWMHRHSLPYPRRPAALGVVFLAAGLALNYLGLSAFFGFLQALAFILVLLGIIAAMHGWRTFSWALPSMLLLLFAIPLPFRVHVALAEPLQRFVALGSTSLLQLRGRPAISMGNVVAVDEHRASVVDACCGLGMLFVFLFLAAAIAAISRRPVLDKLLVFVAAPIAGIAANIVRVSATLEAGLMGYSPDVVKQVHDIGGFLMAPAALLLLMIFLGLISLIFPASKPADEPLQIAFQIGVADQRDQVAPSRKRPLNPSTPTQ